MEQDIIFKAVPVTERQPKEFGQVHVVLIDARILLTAQYNPQGWCYMSGMPATSIPKLIAGNGVSHWLERQDYGR